MLLVYQAPCCPVTSLTKLVEAVSGMLLKNLRTIVLGDFNIHAETALTGLARSSVASTTTTELCQVVTEPIHNAGHILDLILAPSKEVYGQEIMGVSMTLLSLSDYFLVKSRLMVSPAREGGIRMTCPQRLQLIPECLEGFSGGENWRSCQGTHLTME